MRHAHKNAATNEEPKPSLVPKLRFPEFEGAGAWASRTFGDVTTKTDKRNKGGISYPVYSISNKAGFVPQSEQFAGVDSEKRGYDLAQYKLVGRNTFAYNPARINVGSIGFSGDLENVIVSSLYVCFKSNLEADDQFLQHFFSTRMFERSVCNHAEGGIRSYLFYENFSRIEILLPTLPEQQRIASCLSSLDELIDAQARKVDALKTHKKGLMQQLFPREGETQPRLRFPEFEGEWEERRLGDVATFHKGKGISKADISINGRTPCIRYGELYTVYGEIVDNVQSRTDIPVADLFLSQNNDVIIPASGETRLDIAKAACVIHDDVALGGDLNVIRTSHRGVFLSYYLNGPKRYDIAKVAQGDTVAHLYPSQLKKLVVSLPSEAEQQRIADCLSSLDDLITNESHKLETYKTHKKGLMQGLFPKVGD